MEQFIHQPGDYVVCPGHGVGQVSGVEEKELGGTVKSFYIIKIVATGMTVMVPTDFKAGVRSLVKAVEITEVFELLNNHDVKVDTSTWNRRHREYINKVKTGSLLEIADVLRSLFLLRLSKKLSFGEKKMMEQCRDLLVKEIAISSGDEEQQVNGKIDSCFNS